jgi:putative esterase
VGSNLTLAAIDEVLGGQPWRRPLDWGAFFLVFPTGRPWTVPADGWHVDADYTGPLSPPKGVKVTRTRELTPNPEFAAFLARELLPWVHARYHVTSDPRMTLVAGSSFGGLAATYAALLHPELFGNVLCQSGDFSWAPDHIHAMGKLADAMTETGWFAKEFIKSPRLPIRFHMDAGVFDQVGTGGNVLETSRHMRDVLLAKGYEVHYQQFFGGHDVKLLGDGQEAVADAQVHAEIPSQEGAEARLGSPGSRTLEGRRPQ